MSHKRTCTSKLISKLAPTHTYFNVFPTKKLISHSIFLLAESEFQKSKVDW